VSAPFSIVVNGGGAFESLMHDVDAAPMSTVTQIHPEMHSQITGEYFL
jgi:hypothetical protein